MALTIIEAAKLNPGDVVRTAIVEMYARNSDILRVLPFENIAGNALKYNREDILPGVGFRGVNEDLTESVGVLNPITESLVIAGGDFDVDHSQAMGTNQFLCNIQLGLTVKALARRWILAFIKGDSSPDPHKFDADLLSLLKIPLQWSIPLPFCQSRFSKKTISFYFTSKCSLLKRLQI